MALDRKPVMIQLDEEAYAALSLICEMEQKDLGEKARELLERMLLGEGYAATVHAQRLARALNGANQRESALKSVKRG